MNGLVKNNFKLKKIAAAILINLFILTVNYFVETYRLTNLDAAVKESQLKIDSRYSLFVTLSTQLGFGGFIHHFKNYIIRSEDQYYDGIETEINEIYLTLAAYQLLQLNDDEKTALIMIRKVMDQYQVNSVLAKNNTNAPNPLTIKKIDFIVRIDDTEMIKGLATLKIEGNKYQALNDHTKEAELREAIVFLVIKLIILCYVIVQVIYLLFYLRKVQLEQEEQNRIQKYTLVEKQKQEQLLKLKTQALGTEILLKEELTAQLNITKEAFKTTEAIIITNTDLDIINVNDAFTSITGYSRKEVLGKPVSILKSGKQNSDFYLSMWHQIDQMGRWSGRVVNKDKSGMEFIASLTIREIKNTKDQVVHYVAHLNDITGYERAQVALTRRLRIESIISKFSIKALESSVTNFDEVINDFLQVMGRELDVERSYVFNFTNHKSLISNTHEWCASGVAIMRDSLQNMQVDEYSWIMSQLLNKQLVRIDSVDNLPLEAQAEQQELRRQGVLSALLVPIFGDNNIIGFFGFDRTIKARNWREEDVKLLRMIAEIFYLVQHRHNIEKENTQNFIALSRLVKEKSKLLDQNNLLTLGIIHAQEKERKYLAQELHDELGQLITGIRINSTHLLSLNKDESNKDTIKNMLEKIEKLSVDAITRLRLTTRKIRTATLDQIGLEPALKELLNDWQDSNPETTVVSQIDIDEIKLSGNKPLDLCEELTVTLYRAVQEALTNITKYAQAKNVTVVLQRVVVDNTSGIQLTILDDGVGGIDSQSISNGIGLLGMKERVLSLKGEWSIVPGENQKGTRVEIYIPLTRS